MKSFAYTAVDATGRPVSGTVEAADWPTAQALLTARGLKNCHQASFEPQLSSPGSPVERAPALNAADALELASYLSQLIKADLPLGGALRAAANELPAGALAGAMRSLAGRLEAGQPLDAAVEQLAERLPPHWREMIMAGTRSGRLAQTLDAILAHERAMDDMTRQCWRAAAYPTVVLAFLVGWLLFAAMWLVPAMQVESLARDFNSNLLPSERYLTEFARVAPPLIFATLIATLLTVVATLAIGGREALSRLATQVPLLGPAWWNRGLFEFCGLLSIFLDLDVPLGEALRRVAKTARDPAVSAACRRAAVETDNGCDLATCLARAYFFPPTLVCLIRWGELHGALRESLVAGREIFSLRLEQQTQLVRLILPPIVFMAVAASVLLLVGWMYVAVGQFLFALANPFMFWGSPSPAARALDTVTKLLEPIQFSGVASVLAVGITLVLAAQMLKAMAVEAEASLRLLRYTGLVLLAGGLTGACLMIANFIGAVLIVIVSIIWYRAAMQYRVVQKRNLLSLLSLAVKKQMPLAPLALAFANEQEGGFALRTSALAKHLAKGVPLAAAIAWSRGVLPPEAALAAHIASESRDLSESLSATTYNRAFDRALMRPVITRLIYIFPVMLVFLAYMKVEIEPTLRRIFVDFGIPLPELTRQVMGWNGTGILASFFVLVLAMMATGLLAWLQWRGTLKPRLPILKRTINWVDMGVALRVLALAARLNRPLPSMLHAMSKFHPKLSVRNRLQWVVWETNNGVPWQESLRRQQLLSKLDAAILTAAQRSGNLPWALSEMADSFERRATHRLQAMAQVILPLLMLPVGVFVLILAAAYFSPLPLLIKSLST